MTGTSHVKLTRPVVLVPSEGAKQVEGAAASPTFGGGKKTAEAMPKARPSQTRGPRPTLTTQSPRAPRNTQNPFEAKTW